MRQFQPTGHNDHSHGRNAAKRDGWHGVRKHPFSHGDAGLKSSERRDRDVFGSDVASERHIRVKWNVHGNGYNQLERRGYLIDLHREYDIRLG